MIQMRDFMSRLHLEYYNGSGANQDKIPVNCDIRKYIKETEGEDYSHILARDDRWQVFYHLSPMRTSVLNWYEFKKDAEVLEIGGEFGALTGLLCDRCKRVVTVEYGDYKSKAIQERYRKRENLDIYAGDVVKMPLEQKFDYIVMIGCMERQCNGSKKQQDYIDYLKAIMRFLKPNGKFLISVENKYGLRYFCGEKEYYTKMPFGGINQYQTPAKGYTFGRHELTQILIKSGLEKYRFYYPLPDYKLPQMIYSDEYLPQKDLGERLLFYHIDATTLIAPEQWLYSDMIDNQVFPFFANSFLVECSVNEEAGDIVFAAVTTDRGRDHGLSTSVHGLNPERRIVKKKALYTDGQDSINTVYKNISALQQKGVSIVPHQLEGSTLVMPFIPEITCSDYLRKLAVEGDKARFENIFRMIYENILRSSETVNTKENALPEAKEFDRDYGIILKYCYVDMIPFNCFYVNGTLMYFDQEFVRENYPASYPMYRALMYTYAFIPEAEKLIPLSVMKERYMLTDLWDIYQKVENRFVADNRRYDVYQNFYRWTGMDIGRMQQNTEILGR